MLHRALARKCSHRVVRECGKALALHKVPLAVHILHSAFLVCLITGLLSKELRADSYQKSTERIAWSTWPHGDKQDLAK